MESGKKRIAIVGGGLVGALQACFMAQRGFKVSIFEKRHDGRSERGYFGRSINLAISHRGLSALKRLDLDGFVKTNAIPMRARMIHDKNGKKHPIQYDPDGRCINSIERAGLNNFLLSYAETLPNVELHFNHKLIAMNCELDEPELTFEISQKQRDNNFNDDENKQLRKYNFDLVIGCDGAYSMVRTILMRTTRLDFSQTYIDHGYMEFRIDPKNHDNNIDDNVINNENDNDNYVMEKNYLHIWPRGQFMMIALPNKDASFTCTLFMPMHMFDNLAKTPEKGLEFFHEYFPDSIDLIGGRKIVDTFQRARASSMISIKSRPYHYKGKVVIMGDSAHAMVPFYGQGMNCGFEDCLVFDEILDKYYHTSILANDKDNNFDFVLQEFTRRRCDNGHAMCDLAMYNFIEMRDLVNSKMFAIRKHFDNFLYRLMPKTWVPLYTMVTFSRIPIDECVRRRKWQDKFIERAYKWPIVLFTILLPIFILSLKHQMKC